MEGFKLEISMKMDVSMMLMNMMIQIHVSSNDHIRRVIYVREVDGDPCMVELLAVVMNQGEFLCMLPTHHQPTRQLTH
jgi:hypothetical protein